MVSYVLVSSAPLLLVFLTTAKNHSRYHHHRDEFTYSRDMLSEDIRLGVSKIADYRGEKYYFFVADPENDTIVSKIMLETGGMWEENLNMLYKNLLDAKRNVLPNFQPRVIDLGVNFGSFTLFAASQHSLVWGFDIQQSCLSMVDLGLHVNQYKHHVHLYNYAAWDTAGKVFRFQVYDHNYGGTSIVGNALNNGMGPFFSIHSTRIDEVYTENVPLFFVKTDCEGCEPHALLGMQSLILDGCVENIALEVRSVSILEPFYHLGYECRAIQRDQGNWFESFEVARKIPISGYLDMHCQIGSPPIPLEDLRKKLNLEGSLVMFAGDSDKNVYKIQNGTRYFVGSKNDIGDSLKVVEVSYGSFFMYPLYHSGIIDGETVHSCNASLSYYLLGSCNDGKLYRRTAGHREIYLCKSGNSLHAFPNIQTFVKMGFDFGKDLVSILRGSVFDRLVKEPLPAL